MDILVKNGMIVNADKSFIADIKITDGKVTEVGTSLDIKSSMIIDAANKYVFPGGIDPHVHHHLSGPAGYSADNFYTGSKAALHGGTTSFIDFCYPPQRTIVN